MHGYNPCKDMIFFDWMGLLLWGISNRSGYFGQIRRKMANG